MQKLSGAHPRPPMKLIQNISLNETLHSFIYSPISCTTCTHQNHSNQEEQRKKHVASMTATRISHVD